jgi:hypothetical protein
MKDAKLVCPNCSGPMTNLGLDYYACHKYNRGCRTKVARKKSGRLDGVLGREEINAIFNAFDAGYAQPPDSDQALQPTDLLGLDIRDPSKGPRNVMLRSVRVKCRKGCIREYFNVQPGHEDFYCCGNVAQVLSDKLVESDGGRMHSERTQRIPIVTAPASGFRSGRVQRGRKTHCWKCKENLSSRSDRTCEDCGWLECSCGACSPDC